MYKNIYEFITNNYYRGTISIIVYAKEELLFSTFFFLGKQRWRWLRQSNRREVGSASQIPITQPLSNKLPPHHSLSARQIFKKMQAIGVLSKSHRLTRVLINPWPSLLNVAAERVSSCESVIENACAFSYSHPLCRGFHSAVFFSGMTSPAIGVP